MSTTTSESLSTLTGTYELDPTHTRLGFATKHAMVATVRGSFGDFSGVLTLDAEDPSRSAAQIDIVVDSVDTGNAQRDGHLRTNDFFESEKYPAITFRSTRAAVKTDGESYQMWGDLTVKGITREVQLDLDYQGTATDPYGNLRVGFEGRTTVNRKDFGLTWNVALETGGILVGEKVKIELDVSAVRKTG
ncbi:MAG: YceI family protein [Actinomycetota bacterium]|nr:YceI family protein [Actinomycetota bacterium]